MITSWPTQYDLSGGPVIGTTGTFSGQVTSNAKNTLTVNDTQIAQPPVGVVVGASPFSYAATEAGIISVSGGIVTAMTLTQDGVVVWSSSQVSGVIPVFPGDIIRITYTSVPTIYATYR